MGVNMKVKDIEYFKDLLIERKKQIIRNIDGNTKELEGMKGLDLNDEIDYASVSADSALEQTINSQQLKELKDIDYALEKIEDTSYGICEMCEEKITKQRLKVKPQAKYCIVCREIVEKSDKKG